MAPRNAVVILLDSLNRHMVGAYGGTEFDTPNLDAFAKRAIRFDRHYAGALPCMPARHDLLCGALDFLWKPWGSIEMWEDPITVPLRRAGVKTMLISDHPHLFETGGENYHCDFTAWDYQRGHEGDAWKTRPDPSWLGAPSFNRGWMPYDNSRGYFRGEEDFPGPRTMRAAADWLRDHAPQHAAAGERFLLFVDEFDPHEPFDTPEPYASMYDPDWEGPHLIWPPYSVRAVERGLLTPEQARQVRASYGGKLTMIDAWLGRVLAAIDTGGLWDDTAVIVCTDHGHYLGEKDCFGKPGVPIYEPLGHTPLLIHWPGASLQDGASVDALTTNVDLNATLCELFDVSLEHVTHGMSLVPLLTGTATEVRDWLLTGVWGREVHFVDSEVKYARAPVSANFPLGMWSNRWSTMPIPSVELRLPLPDSRASLAMMPGSTVPVIHQVWTEGDAVPYWAGRPNFTGNHLWRPVDDPAEDNDLAGSKAGKEASDKLREILREVEAPDEQFARLGME